MAAKCVSALKKHDDLGILAQLLNLDDCVIMVLHDAAFANATGLQWIGYNLTLLLKEFLSMGIYSRLGYLVLLVEKQVLEGKAVRVNLVNWRSHICKRVVYLRC